VSEQTVLNSYLQVKKDVTSIVKIELERMMDTPARTKPALKLGDFWSNLTKCLKTKTPANIEFAGVLSV
jgi:hypothetical protein